MVTSPQSADRHLIPLMTAGWKYSLIDVKKSNGRCQVGQCANVELIIKPSLCYMLVNYSANVRNGSVC